MKQFKLSECKWKSYEGSKWVDGLVFPHGRTVDEPIFEISIYQDKDGEPFECSLSCQWNEYTPQNELERVCNTEEEIEAFVNECFKYVHSYYEQYLVDDMVLFKDRQKALDVANGREVEAVYGPYATMEMYEFFEGNGGFKERKYWRD